MAVNEDDKIRKPSAVRRNQVEARAVELIAEEGSCAVSQDPEAHTGTRGESARDHAGQRLAARKA